MRTRCPHCRHPVEIVADDPLVEIHCTACGSTFSLATGRTETFGAGKTVSFGQFELLEELGRGAFGSVWKAHDRELDRVVALKLPRQQGLDGVEMERFLREARSAAQLHHPGVVSIHEIGRDNDQTYIVSDFVQGATLADWIKSKPLSLQEIAELVARVADALAHAHERGVVHRDLKPANILMDAHGQPHVTDFGLAKRDAGEITMTVEGQILGTPAYMSPEQARGEGHRVDARADIYSLGVILYELLCGELPFRGSSRMMIMQILHDEPPSPRKLRANVPRDLETIALKCLAKAPDRRYPTAAELAADLRRWLAGEPIRARPATRVERAVRWCQRNKLVAALMATSAVLLVAVAVISTAAAVHQAALARRARVARNEAEFYFRSAFRAVEEMLTEVGDESLADIPYLERTRQTLLEEARDFYESLVQARPGDPGLLKEHALAYFRVGRINALLARSAEAEQAYRQAIRLFEELAARFPDAVEHRHHLAVSHDWLAELFRETVGDLVAAEEHYRRALALQRQLARDGPAEARLELARTYNNLGILLTNTGRLAEADTALSRAVEGLEQLVDEHPGVAEYQADLARSLINVGVLCRKQREIPEAENAYGRAADVLARLVETHAQDSEYQYKFAVNQLNLANLIMEETPQPADATPHCDEAVRLLEQLTESFPGIPRYHLELANSVNTQANLLARLGDFEQAKGAFEQALAHLDELAERFPDLPKSKADFRSLRGLTLGGLSFLALQRGATEEARDLALEAIEEQTAAVQLDEDSREYPRRLKLHYEFLAQILKQLGESEEASKVLRTAEQLKPAA